MNWRNLPRVLLCGLALQCNALPALADFTATQGSGITIASTVVTSKHYQDMVICDPTAGQGQCAGVNASGQLAIAGPVTNAGTFAVQDATLATDIGAPGATACTTDTASCSTNQQMQRLAQRLTTVNTTLGSPFQAGGSIGNTTFAATQATSSNLKAQVDPLTAASWGIGTATQNSTSATNGQLALAQFNTSPTTITSGNMSPLQMDNAGNLLVNIKAGAGSGGTAITDNAAFTTGTTSETPIGCYAGTPSATANHSTIVACTTAGSVHTTVDNTNANGSAVSASSSPVVIASDQAAVAIKAASASIASGAIASGAVASGAFASGAIGSGAVASGAIASGAIASGAFAAGSFVNATAGDPCMFQPKTNVPISTASGTVALVTGVSAKKIYVCSITLVISTPAVSVSLAEGSSSTCGTSNQAAVMGVATNGTAANGLPFAVNGGLTLGNGGGTVASTATNANYLCLFQSGTTQMAGNLTYVQQ